MVQFRRGVGCLYIRMSCWSFRRQRPSRRPAALKVEIEVRNQDNNIVATGAIGLPDAAVIAPALSQFPVLPVLEEKPVIARGGMYPGQRLFTLGTKLDPEEHKDALDRFQETSPDYTKKNISQRADCFELLCAMRWQLYLIQPPQYTSRRQHSTLG